MPIPIVILNYNREQPLRALIDYCMSLEGRGDIWVIDNGSTWAPTLTFYDDISTWPSERGVRLVRMGANLGLRAVPVFLERHPLAGRVAFTDPDLVPYSTTPRDVLEVASAVLDDLPDLLKVGVGLEIEDVPDSYFDIGWIRYFERQVWGLPLLPCGRGRRAAVDTTFAVYRSADLFRTDTEPAVRLDRPYVMKHVDWYEDPNAPSLEFLAYAASCGREASGVLAWRQWKKSPSSHDAWLRRRIRTKENRAIDARVAAGATPATRDGIRGLAPEDEDELIAFQSHAFPDRRGPLLPDWWRWAFVDSARRVGVEPRVWALRNEGRVVGQLASIPVEATLGATRRTLAWLVDLKVPRKYRDRGVAADILAQACDGQRAGLLLGQSEDIGDLSRALGWENVAPLQRSVLVVNPERALHGKWPAAVAWAGSACLRAAARFRTLVTTSHSVTVREIARFDRRHDALWERASIDLTCTVVRDASYLNWQYADPPGQSFLMLDVLEGDTLLGCAVWSVREPDEVHHYRRGLLMEVVAPPSNLCAVVRAASGVAATRADTLQCLHIGAALSSALRKNGYRRRPQGRFLLVRSEDFTAAERPLVLDEASWFVVQGDSDLERL